MALAISSCFNRCAIDKFGFYFSEQVSFIGGVVLFHGMIDFEHY